MHQPFIFLGLGALAASLSLLYSIPVAVFCLGLMALWAIVFIVSKKNGLNKGVVIALIFVILAVRLISLEAITENKNQQLIHKTVDFKARIISVDYNSGKFAVFSLKVLDCTEKTANNIKLKATMMAQTDALPGDIISAKAVFTLPSEKYRARDYSNGYYYFADISKVYYHESREASFWRVIYNLRESIASAISSTGKDELSAVLNALIIGDKSGISPEFSLAVQNSGVSHMLVVSGMHLGILCGVLMNLMKRRIKLVPSIIIGISVVLFMLAVCLFHVSILRASIAYIVMLLSRLFKRSPDSLSALGFGAVVAVLLAPHIFHNVAFQLSISATFAVLYPSRLLINMADFKRFGRPGKLLRYVYDILAISVCCMFCTMPIAVSYFGYVALAAPITNLLVSLAISAALIIGVFAVIIFFLPLGKYISLPLFFLARAFTRFFTVVVEFIGEKGFGVVLVEKDKSIYCFVIAIAFILLVKLLSVYIIKRKEKKLC